MEKILEQILGSELLNEETKAQIGAAFTKAIEEGVAAKEKALREEYAKRYDHDKEKTAEAVEQFIESRMNAEIAELRSNMESLERQRAKYVEATEALKTNAKAYVEKRLKTMEAVIERALRAEIGELREDMKTNRKAVLKVIAETKARGEADRKAFKTKAARVLEHIATVKLTKQMDELREDIKVAKENDFGRRIFEAYIAEARLSFFNSSKEHKALLQKIATMESEHKKAVEAAQKALNEAEAKAKKAVGQANRLSESVQRSQSMTRLLSTVPAGPQRSKMKTLLEATATADLEKTFKKYVGQLLTEARQPVGQTKRVNEAALELRTGSPKQAVNESAAQTAEDDEDVVFLRRIMPRMK